jgi:hypothetical protein
MDCVAALPLLASNGLAANKGGAIEFAASLPLRYRCLLQTDYLQQMKWVQLNLLPLRYRCLLQTDYLQQMKWVQFNSLRRCAAAGCFKWITCQ